MDDGRVGIETAESRKELLEPTYMSVKKRWTVMERDYLSDDLRVKATTAWTFKDLNSERGTEQFVDLGFDKNIFPRPNPWVRFSGHYCYPLKKAMLFWTFSLVPLLLPMQ